MLGHWISSTLLSLADVATLDLDDMTLLNP